MRPPSDPPTLACGTCKARKRKCDKGLPKCSLCTSKGLSCRYPTIERGVHHEPQLPSPQSTSSSTALSPRGTADAECAPLNTFPPVFYLDWTVFQQCQVELPKPSLPLPPNVSKLIGNLENWEIIAAEYFDTAHTWMPIVSKKTFYEHIHAPSWQLPSDYALLVLAMDVICFVPANDNPRTPAYLAAKSFYLDLEIQGLVSLQIMQAAILIALFELGHAIFPSAAVSIEACVRYGCALGINWDAKFPAKKPFSWVEVDEQNRVWWAVVILDRISRIGYPRRPFLVGDPSSEAILPSDDRSWDEGVMPPKCFGVVQSSSPRVLGRFALKAEATRLLGQVIGHVEATNFGDPLHDEESFLLDRALRALVTVVEFEGQNHNLDVMNQTLICSIALIMLHEAHASRSSTATSEYFEPVHHTKHLTNLVIKSREEISELQTPFQSCVKAASPFMSTLLYQVASANLRRCQEMRTAESLEALAVMKAALKDFGGRWKASGAYLQILEAREVSYAR